MTVAQILNASAESTTPSCASASATSLLPIPRVTWNFTLEPAEPGRSWYANHPPATRNGRARIARIEQHAETAAPPPAAFAGRRVAPRLAAAAPTTRGRLAPLSAGPTDRGHGERRRVGRVRRRPHGWSGRACTPGSWATGATRVVRAWIYAAEAPRRVAAAIAASPRIARTRRGPAHVADRADADRRAGARGGAARPDPVVGCCRSTFPPGAAARVRMRGSDARGVEVRLEDLGRCGGIDRFAPPAPPTRVEAVGLTDPSLGRDGRQPLVVQLDREPSAGDQPELRHLGPGRAGGRPLVTRQGSGKPDDDPLRPLVMGPARRSTAWSTAWSAARSRTSSGLARTPLGSDRASPMRREPRSTPSTRPIVGSGRGRGLGRRGARRGAQSRQRVVDRLGLRAATDRDIGLLPHTAAHGARRRPSRWCRPSPRARRGPCSPPPPRPPCRLPA